MNCHRETNTTTTTDQPTNHSPYYSYVDSSVTTRNRGCALFFCMPFDFFVCYLQHICLWNKASNDFYVCGQIIQFFGSKNKKVWLNVGDNLTFGVVVAHPTFYLHEFTSSFVIFTTNSRYVDYVLINGRNILIFFHFV